MKHEVIYYTKAAVVGTAGAGVSAAGTLELINQVISMMSGTLAIVVCCIAIYKFINRDK